MQTTARPLRRDDASDRRPSLRLYDPRLSALLAEVPESRDVPQPDVNGWLHGRRLLVAPAGNLSVGYQLFKRGFDIVGSLALLALLSPILLATFAALLITTRGKPVFRQTRVGHCGRLFEMYKFRTMRLDALQTQAQVANEQDGPVFKSRRDPRITRLGRILRKLSIDETPQLINVLRGEMTLVGPRPALPAEVAKYQPWQFQRLAVKPGLTCLWQVSGRCDIECFDDWVRLDLWYVERQNTATDLKLLLKTPLCVLSCRGAY